jgi:hypothetical protein
VHLVPSTDARVLPCILQIGSLATNKTSGFRNTGEHSECFCCCPGLLPFQSKVALSLWGSGYLTSAIKIPTKPSFIIADSHTSLTVVSKQPHAL